MLTAEVFYQLKDSKIFPHQKRYFKNHKTIIFSVIFFPSRNNENACPHTQYIF